MSEVPLYPSSGERVMIEPLEVLGSYEWPTVGAYAPIRLFKCIHGTSLIRERPLLAPYHRPMLRVLGGS